MDITPNACTACDPLFFSPLTTPQGSCALSPGSIYNTTFNITGGWTDLNGAAPLKALTPGSPDQTWIDIADPGVVTSINYLNLPHYGIRCRILFHFENNLRELYFSVNGTYT